MNAKMEQVNKLQAAGGTTNPVVVDPLGGKVGGKKDDKSDEDLRNHPKPLLFFKNNPQNPIHTIKEIDLITFDELFTDP
jgi:hypothetical protein